MGTGASLWKGSRHKAEASATDAEEFQVDAKRFISADQEIVVSGELWKLNNGADPQAPREWLKRWVWLTDTGGFFYYSRQFHKPLGCYVGRLGINTPEATVLGRYVIEIGADASLGVKPTTMACDSEEDRNEWVKCIQIVQATERNLGEDQISPLEPFSGHGLQNKRQRLSITSAGMGSLTLSAAVSECKKDPIYKSLSYASSSSSTLSAMSGAGCGGETFGDKIKSHCSTLVVPSRPSVKPEASTGMSVFASPQLASRGGFPLKMRTPIRRNSQASFTESSDTVLILDWDDTLFPTTFIRKDCRLDWRYSLAEQVRAGPGRTQVEELLEKVSEKVEAFLTLACSLAQVVIVTLAVAPWVTVSAQNFTPRLGKLIEQHKVEVIYAREKISEAVRQEYASEAFHSSADEATYWMRAKAAAMEDAFRKIHGNSGGSWKNIISIGDSDFERVALATVASEHFRHVAKGGQILETGRTAMVISKDGHLQRLRAKTIKMLDEPSIEEMIAEATLFHAWLPHVIHKDAGVDIDLVGSQDDNYLTEVHRWLTGTNETVRWRDLATVEE